MFQDLHRAGTNELTDTLMEDFIMKYRTMGKTGYKVSEIGFGTLQFGGLWAGQSDEDSINALSAAAEQGVNFIDTAGEYGYGKSERIIGKFIKDAGKKIYIATKTQPLPGPWPPSPYNAADDRYPESYLRSDVDERLKSLGVPKLDILLLHTWTRAWNSNPTPLNVLQKLKKQGKVENIGISTPEHDQNSVIDLIRNGLVDVVEVIYNIFEQEPVAELLPTAAKYNIGLISRMPFDEGALTGKYTSDTVFAEGDLRRVYFKGDRLSEALVRVEKVKEDIKETGLTLPQAALLFVLNQPSVSTVIAGMPKVKYVFENTAVSDMPPLSEKIVSKLRNHNWLRAYWYPE
jgi:aryl-alcohol dehydrogenase-like predicted oxidoreductase